VLGNVGDAASIPALVSALGDDEPLVRGAAAWALGQFSDPGAQRALQSRRLVEDNADVASEIEAALKQVAPVS
jgi:epoxyqueuosine reductase